MYCLALTMNYKSRSISSLGSPEWIWKECISYLQVEAIDSRVREVLRDLLFVDMLSDLWFNTSSNAVTRNYLFESIRKVATDSKSSVAAASIFAAAAPTLRRNPAANQGVLETDGGECQINGTVSGGCIGDLGMFGLFCRSLTQPLLTISAARRRPNKRLQPSALDAVKRRG